MILVTGVNGFAGKHLVKQLHNNDISIVGLGKNEAKPDNSIANKLKDYIQCDIADKNQVGQIDFSKIDTIVNLAGLANVGLSYLNASDYMRINVDVFELLAKKFFSINKNGRVIAISSCAVYQPSKRIIFENSKLISNGSPYAHSKLKMEKIATNYKKNGFDCIIARPFNHIGPGQGLGFLIPDMIAKLEQARKTNEITVGNIYTSRDYTDVRDIVKAYASLITKKDLDNEYIFNICSGKSIKGEEIIKKLCKIMGIDFNNLKINIDESLIRPSDPMQICGDYSRLRKITGWKPTINLDQTLRDIYEQSP